MDEERRREPRPPVRKRVSTALGVAVFAAVWVPAEALLLWATVAAATTPFGVGPTVDDFPHDWLAVLLATNFGVLTAGWTAVGWGVAAPLVRGPRGVAEAVDGRGVRADRPLVVPGHEAYLDDRGATLVESRRSRRVAARWTAGLAVVCGVNAAATTKVPSAGGGMWVLTTALGAGTVCLAAATVAFVRWTPRWIARPGAVVFERRRGARFTFEARRLELVRRESEGVVGHELVAVADPRGAARARRRTMLVAGEDPAAIREVGEWLARHAEIPFETTARQAGRS